MGHPLVAAEVGHQHLAAPQRAVGAVAQPVEGQAQHRRRPTVLDHARRDVGVVVLHADGRQVELEGELGRQVLRVEVVGHHLGLHAVEVAEVVDRLQERAVRGQVLEVADVVAGHHGGALHDADRALQLGPEREDLAPAHEGQRERLGRVAPRPAEHLEPAGGGPGHGVVAADVDRPVVGEEPVDEGAQAGDGVVVVVGDGLVAEVPARHHQRPPDPGHEKVVERAVGQQDAELGQAGGDGVGHLRAGPAGHQDDGPSRAR